MPQPPFDGGPQGPGGFLLSDDFATALATNLGLPTDTVRTAFQQTLQQVQPPPPDGAPGSMPGGFPGGAPPNSEGFGPQGPGPQGAPPSDGQGGPRNAGGLGGGPAGFLSDDFVNALAANLGLPPDTVKAALQQAFQQMQPPVGTGSPPFQPQP